MDKTLPPLNFGLIMIIERKLNTTFNQMLIINLINQGYLMHENNFEK